jgi:hypothetical protein
LEPILARHRAVSGEVIEGPARAAFSRDGRHVLVADEGTARLVDAATGALLGAWNGADGSYISLVPDTESAAVVTRADKLRVMPLLGADGRRAPREVQLPRPAWLRPVVLTPDGARLLAGPATELSEIGPGHFVSVPNPDGQDVLAIDASSGKLISRHPVENVTFLCLVLLPDGKRAMVGTGECRSGTRIPARRRAWVQSSATR